MCGRRVEGWRGLVPAGPVDLGAPHAGNSGSHGSGHGPGQSQETAPADAAADAPQNISSGEEPTRPIRISANLAAASASVEDEESRRPTGEVPSIGHEVRAKAPDQRVHTSPTGNILPSEVLQTLDAAIAANSAAAAASPPSARPAGTAAEVSSSFRRPERLKERSGDLPLPRTHLIPPALADLTPRGGERPASPPPRSDRERLALLSDTEALRSGLLNAYLAGHRYRGPAERDDRWLAEAPASGYRGERLWSFLYRLYGTLARPLLFDGQSIALFIGNQPPSTRFCLNSML